MVRPEAHRPMTASVCCVFHMFFCVSSILLFFFCGQSIFKYFRLKPLYLARILIIFLAVLSHPHFWSLNHSVISANPPRTTHVYVEVTKPPVISGGNYVSCLSSLDIIEPQLSAWGGRRVGRTRRRNIWHWRWRLLSDSCFPPADDTGFISPSRNVTSRCYCQHHS